MPHDFPRRANVGRLTRSGNCGLLVFSFSSVMHTLYRSMKSPVVALDYTVVAILLEGSVSNAPTIRILNRNGVVLEMALMGRCHAK
jgi:hypothetical protein